MTRTNKLGLPAAFAVMALTLVVGMAGIVIVADDTYSVAGKSKPYG